MTNFAQKIYTAVNGKYYVKTGEQRLPRAREFYLSNGQVFGPSSCDFRLQTCDILCEQPDVPVQLARATQQRDDRYDEFRAYRERVEKAVKG